MTPQERLIAELEWSSEIVRLEKRARNNPALLALVADFEAKIAEALLRADSTTMGADNGMGRGAGFGDPSDRGNGGVGPGVGRGDGVRRVK